MGKINSKNWGLWVKDFAKRKRGLSINALADELRCSRRTLFRLLANEDPPEDDRKAQLIALAHVLQITIESLVTAYRGSEVVEQPHAVNRDRHMNVEDRWRAEIENCAALISGKRLHDLVKAARDARDGFYEDNERIAVKGPFRSSLRIMGRVANDNEANNEPAPEPHITEADDLPGEARNESRGSAKKRRG